MSNNSTRYGVAFAAVIVVLVSVWLMLRTEAQHQPIPVASAPVAESAPIAAPELEEATARETPAPQPLVDPSRRWSTDPRSESRLGKIMFSFVRKLRTADQALANDWVNPDGLDLTDAHKKELNDLLLDMRSKAGELENEYQIARDYYCFDRLANDQFERITPDYFEGNQERLKPKDNEEEVFVWSTSRKGECLIRIGWDSDPKVTAGRQAVLDFKTQAMEQVRAYVKERGVKK